MRALVQRVLEAQVIVDNNEIGKIGRGLLVFVAVMRGDGQKQLEKMIDKLAGLRLFPDNQGKMNLPVKDVGGEILVVSQFTLAADMNKGFRPSFSQAADPQTARKTLEELCNGLRQRQLQITTGDFGADMKVHLINDGPVTLWLDYPGE